MAGIDLSIYDRYHYALVRTYEKKVGSYYIDAANKIVKAAQQLGHSPTQPFFFAEYPELNNYVRVIMIDLSNNVMKTTLNGAYAQWLLASKKHDDFLNAIFDTTKIPKDILNKYSQRNLSALEAFQKRKIKGLGLSDRVWKYSEQYKNQIEKALDLSIGAGQRTTYDKFKPSAKNTARDVRKYLQDPVGVEERLRDIYGQMNIPFESVFGGMEVGQGVYRDAKKNAERLARTETNMAYREADYLRWQQLDFVIGFDVQVSNAHDRFLNEWYKKNPGKVEICDLLAGRYPKDFKFVGWHPQCMCVATPVLMDEDEFIRKEAGELKKDMVGEQYKAWEATGTVTDVPDGMKVWVADNKDKEWGSPPYFVKDNFVGGDLNKGFRFRTK